jgi:hypothetical protein
MDIGMDPYYHGGDTFSFLGRRAKAKVNAKTKLPSKGGSHQRKKLGIQSRPIWQRLSPKANKKSPVLESCSQALVVLIVMEDAVE